jgi:hypothetical protein
LSIIAALDWKEEDEKEVLLIFCPWLYAATRELKLLLLTNIIPDNIIAAKTV